MFKGFFPASDKRSKISYLILLALLFTSFLSYPFFFKFFFLSIYQLLILSLLGLFLVTLIFNRQKVHSVNKIFFVTYLLYILFLAFASILNVDDSMLKVFLNQAIKVIFLLLFVVIVNFDFINTSLKLYTRIIFFCSLLAILMYFLLMFNLIHPIGTLILSNGVNGSEQVRGNYGLGFLWYNVPTHGINLTRLQSYSDEPGTFALALIPAIFYAYYNISKFVFVILLSALILTLSVGIFLPFVIVMLLISKKKIVYALPIIVCIILIIPENIQSLFLWYIDSKTVGEGSESSVGSRMEGMYAVYEYLVHKPYGLGITAVSNISQSVDSSFITAFLNAGWIGGAFYLYSFLYLLFFAFKFIYCSYSYFQMIGCIYIVFFLSSLSRGLMDITFFHMWIIGIMIFSIRKYTLTHLNKRIVST